MILCSNLWKCIIYKLRARFTGSGPEIIYHPAHPAPDESAGTCSVAIEKVHARQRLKPVLIKVTDLQH